MAYLLTHRELRAHDTGAACIFCGTHHLCPELDEHTGRAYALVDGRVAAFLHCEQPVCPQLEADLWAESSLWRCTCKPSVNVIGPLCPHCKSERVATDLGGFPGDTNARVGGVYVRMVKVVSKHSMVESEFAKVLDRMEKAMPDNAIVVPSHFNDHVEGADGFPIPVSWWKPRTLFRQFPTVWESAESERREVEYVVRYSDGDVTGALQEFDRTFESARDYLRTHAPKLVNILETEQRTETRILLVDDPSSPLAFLVGFLAAVGHVYPMFARDIAEDARKPFDGCDLEEAEKHPWLVATSVWHDNAWATVTCHLAPGTPVWAPPRHA